MTRPKVLLRRFERAGMRYYNNLQPFKVGEERTKELARIGGMVSAKRKRSRAIDGNRLSMMVELMTMRESLAFLLREVQQLETKLATARSDRDKYRKRWARMAAKQRRHIEQITPKH